MRCINRYVEKYISDSTNEFSISDLIRMRLTPPSHLRWERKDVENITIKDEIFGKSYMRNIEMHVRKFRSINEDCLKDKIIMI